MPHAEVIAAELCDDTMLPTSIQCEFGKVSDLLLIKAFGLNIGVFVVFFSISSAFLVIFY